MADILCIYFTGCLPGRSPPLHSWCQHKSSEELGTCRRRLAGSRWIELLLSPEPVLAHLTHSLNKQKELSKERLGSNFDVRV